MNDVDDNNVGLVTRRATAGASLVVQLLVKPYADIFFQKRFILKGVDLNLKLDRNKDNLVLMAPQNSSFKIKILNTSFCVQ